MGIKRKVAVVLALGFLVIVIQMMALTILNTQLYPDKPFGEDISQHKRDKHSPGIPKHVLLEHEASRGDEKSRIIITVPSASQQHHQPRLPNVKGLDRRVLNQFPDANNLTAERRTTLSKLTTLKKNAVIPIAVHANSFSYFPIDKELWNCDISDVKDAMSALSRAKSHECKELIHNVSCMSKAEKLYNRAIKNTCPLGRHPGSGFVKLPYDAGKGSLATVVFLFSVHGRAFRQVKRLFKAIYHTDHYYFIHVDSRSDYLHRKLYEELSDFPNVYFPTWRMATIWGGASLLQMLLRALQDLEYVLTEWNWDYFINLSESDYPLKTNEELRKFLRVHRGKNFVKTHGGDLNRFIQKQGLDRTFVECDNHMWRIGTRLLPHDINVDGGSDWIAIHRNYSHYLITSKDSFLTDLKRYYKFTLLPAESFFHTVLRNGPMCSTFVKTNLRVTNWNRKLGCRCQYKHVVDWCGCSPNDFLDRDISRLKSVAGDHHFFARKFEAIVNQEVINLLDTHLYGALPPDLPGLNSYWESTYHMEDDVTIPSSAKITTYQSFLRSTLKFLRSEQKTKGNGVQECELPQQAVVTEVSVYRKDDQFKGLIVTLQDESQAPRLFEAFFTPVPFLKKFTFESELAKRILSLEVGSNWDGKESIFRNYGNILGAWDEPVAAIRLASGNGGDINVLWDDPVGQRVSKFTMKLESGWFVSYHKPKLERPIRPGVWSVRLEMIHGALLMYTKFLVVPLTHDAKGRLGSPQAVNAKRISQSSSSSHNKEELNNWRENVTKTGTELDQWVDYLVDQFWDVSGYCRFDGTPSAVADKSCSWISQCQSTSWSTLSPDMKSEIGLVKSNGRIR